MNKSPEHVKKIQEFLESVVQGEYPTIVLHEAVEALGNMDCENTIKLIEKFKSEKSQVLLETCYLTQKLIEWNGQTNHGESEKLDLSKLKFTTNDPAPPYNYIEKEAYRNLDYLK